MPIGAGRDPETELRDFARLHVRAGFLTDDEVRAEVAEAVAAELPEVGGAEVLARAWIAAARKDWSAEAAGWPLPTDYQALQDAFAECEAHDVWVRQGVEDHWVVTQELDAADPRPRGVVWFTQPDVWHAIDDGMLELNLWHGDTANAVEGDSLTTPVLSCLERRGLRARFDEGRIEVASFWRRRPEPVEVKR